MKRFRIWLLTKFLPAYTSIAEREERERLQAVIRDKDAEIERLLAYIQGIKRGNRMGRRSKGVKDGNI